MTVNRTVPKVAPPPATPRFSANPTDLEISEARVFEEPILRVGGEHQDAENRALATALTAYLNSAGGERTAPLQEFLAAHPGTGWRASLLLNLGLVYRRTGYFSRALNAWEEVWLLSKDASDPAGRAVADRGVGELAELNARLGRYDRLDTLFAEIEGRDVRGSAAEKVSAARQGRALMDVRPEDSFRCGPMALDRILAYGRADYRRDEKLTNAKSSLRGMSLTQVRDLSRELGLDMQMAFRSSTAEPVFPAVIHWKAGHFAALIRMDGDRYLVQDPTFGNDMWVTRAALDEEGTGYMIVPAGALMPGWRAVPDAEGDGVWGKGTTAGPEPAATGPAEHTVAPSCSSPLCCNMAGHAVNTLTVNLMVIDTPVTYSPPRGPSVDFTVRHNQRDAYQPQVFSYSNLGPKWTFEWLSYLEDDPAVPAANVDLYRRGSGRETYSGFNSGTQEYAPHFKSRAVVVRTSSSPIEYERRMPDGSKEVFGQPDGGSTFPRKIFMTAWEDTAGNRVSLTFDGSLRIVAATDAIGQVTTLSYDLPTDTRKITKVTDPFGRFATFDYGADGRLQRITDRIGITSEFTYADQDRIDSLTTPYGTTKFAFGDAGRDRWVEITDALGARERIEYRDRTPIPPNEPVPTGFDGAATYLDYRNSIYWDKRAMAIAPGDYTKAQIFHWLHAGSNLTAGTLESERKPLEGRVWYAYPNQSSYAAIGTMATPIKVGRILDDGTTQLYQYEYNAIGNVAKQTDPAGRERRYTYGTNNTPDPDPATGKGIDLLKVEQKNGSSYELLASYAYDAQHHHLLTSTDASGQTTTYTYNAQGQILTVTTPARAGITENRTTTHAYDANGYRQTITGPAAGDTTTITQDSYGRLRTLTDTNNYTVTTDYDSLDRPIRATYPDGTYEETVYNRLDPERRRDRLGRWTHALHDALRRVVAIRDAQGRTTVQGWCTCGSLDKLTDANGNSIVWERDLQGRPIREVRPGSSATELTYESTTSRLKQRRDPKNQLTGYDYFLDDNLKQVTYTNAVVATANVSFTYSSAYNRTATMIDGAGTTTYGYYPVTAPPALGAGRLASVDGPLINDTVSYAYDELGRIASRGVSGFASTYAYDVLGRMITQGSPVGNFTYGYDANSTRPLSLAYPNGQTTQYSYFPVAGDLLLQQIRHLAPGGATISKYDYTYDAQSNIKTWTQQVGASGAKVYELAYDAADQLRTATLRTNDPTPVVLKRYSYDYDPAGNRTTEQIDDSVVGGTFNLRNELISRQAGGSLIFRGLVNEPATVTVGGKPAQVPSDNSFAGSAHVSSGTSNVVVAATDASGNTRTNTYQVGQTGSAISYTYDADGNLTGDGARTFEYDAANRLTRVLNAGSEIARFTYDGLGRRVERVAGGVTTTYVYDAERVAEERLSTGSTLRYLHGPGVDQHWAMQDSGGAITYLLADHLGSIVQTTNAVGQVTLSREYDPYGRPLSGAASSGYAFTGREWDADLGLYHYRARFYDPALARFLSADPLGVVGRTNGYAYVENQPTRFIDPTGLQSSNTGLAPPPDPPAGCSAGAWKCLGVSNTRSREEQVFEPAGGPQITLPNANGKQGERFGTEKAPRGQNGGSAPSCLCYYRLKGRVKINEAASTWERTVCCNGVSYDEQRQGDWFEVSRGTVPTIMANPGSWAGTTHNGLNYGGGCHCPPSP